jgi:hypothetical protein
VSAHAKTTAEAPGLRGARTKIGSTLGCRFEEAAVAKKKTKKRLAKAIRKAERRRQEAARRPPLGPGSAPGYRDMPPPWDTTWDDDDDGGAGVREPRHPFPVHPAGAVALEPPRPQYLDLVG